VPASARERVALDANGNLSSLVSRYSAAYGVPESLIRRVIKRESGGNARLVSRGNYGLMQIKLGTARSMGYTGGAAGLLDADTNMRFAVKYLAGALRAARGSHDGAVHYYASGYYYAEKRAGLRHAAIRASASDSYAMLNSAKAFGNAIAAPGPLMSPASPNFH
jgi:soluble lytic murein transglycosylase-like protein